MRPGFWLSRKKLEIAGLFAARELLLRFIDSAVIFANHDMYESCRRAVSTGQQDGVNGSLTRIHHEVSSEVAEHMGDGFRSGRGRLLRVSALAANSSM